MIRTRGGSEVADHASTHVQTALTRPTPSSLKYYDAALVLTHSARGSPTSLDPVTCAYVVTPKHPRVVSTIESGQTRMDPSHNLRWARKKKPTDLRVPH